MLSATRNSLEPLRGFGIDESSLLAMNRCYLAMNNYMSDHDPPKCQVKGGGTCVGLSSGTI